MGGKNRRCLASINKLVRKIYFGKSGIHGNGIFARKNIGKCETVFIAKGKMQKLNLDTKDLAMSNPDMIGVEKNVWLDPSLLWGAFINHSCKPNTGIKGKVTFVALKNIKKDEEITFDYSISEDSLWEMECNCGSKNCRRVIKSIKFLPEKKFKEYLPFIPTYFQKVYRKSNNLHT
jgi:uncharacterized protein